MDYFLHAKPCLVLNTNSEIMVMHLALPKRPMNLFQTVEQNQQQALKAQALRAYCPNVYTVPICMKLANWN